MAETTSLEQKTGVSSFWSPWVVFFFGIPFAALNWWRMRKKKKAVFYMTLSIFVYLLTSWAHYKGGITPTDHEIFTMVSLARLFITGTFVGLIAVIMHIDIQRFEKAGSQPASVKWPVFFVFCAVLIASGAGAWAALDYGARETGKCRFPRLQDVVYQKELAKRTGLATLVLGRHDFSCDWNWDLEIAEPIAPNGYRLLLVNEIDNMDDPSFSVSERIFQYEEVTLDEFSKVVQNDRQLKHSEYPVEIIDPNAQYSNIHCVRSGEYTFCNLFLGYKNIISRFQLDFSNLSDEQINSLIQLVVTTNSQRVQAYEGK